MHHVTPKLIVVGLLLKVILMQGSLAACPPDVHQWLTNKINSNTDYSDLGISASIRAATNNAAAAVIVTFPGSCQDNPICLEKFNELRQFANSLTRTQLMQCDGHGVYVSPPRAGRTGLLISD